MKYYRRDSEEDMKEAGAIWRALFDQHADLASPGIVTNIWQDGMYNRGLLNEIRYHPNILNLNIPGWQIVPTMGDIDYYDFFDAIAQSKFPVNMNLRGMDEMNSVEYDMFTDIFGMLPILHNTGYSVFLRTLAASYGVARNKELSERLINLFRNTVTFGAVVEDEQAKAFGAGIIASANLLKEFSSANVEHIGVFDAEMITDEEVDPSGDHKQFFLLDSYLDLFDLLNEVNSSFSQDHMTGIIEEEE